MNINKRLFCSFTKTTRTLNPHFPGIKMDAPEASKKLEDNRAVLRDKWVPCVSNPPMKTEELKNVVDVLRELGVSYEDTLDAMSGVANELCSASLLWRKGDKSKLIGLGLTLIAFPEPTLISDILGAVVLSAGIIQTKMRQSTLHIEDVYNNFQGVITDLQTINNFFLGRQLKE